MTCPPPGMSLRDVIKWLEVFAEDNDREAKWTWNPIMKIKYRGQAWAFRVAADMVKRVSRW